jgi:hypothetical protein
MTQDLFRSAETAGGSAAGNKTESGVNLLFDLNDFAVKLHLWHLVCLLPRPREVFAAQSAFVAGSWKQAQHELKSMRTIRVRA